MITERLLGLDIGERRIGVAISDEMGTIASPLVTISTREDIPARIRQLTREYGVRKLIVGLPVSLSGKEGPQAAEVRTVADELAATLEMEIEYSDERLSTSVANQALLKQGVRRNKRNQHIDAMAAAVILQGYLDAQRWRTRT